MFSTLTLDTLYSKKYLGTKMLIHLTLDTDLQSVQAASSSFDAAADLLFW